MGLGEIRIDKMYKFSVTRWIRPKGIMYNMVTTADDCVLWLKSAERVELKCSVLTTPSSKR